MNQPLDAQVIPRFAGPASFFRLPVQEEIKDLDVALLGIPFDSAASFRPGARFGPRAIREMSSLLRPYNRVLDVKPYETLNVADIGDCRVNPFDTLVTLDQIAGQISDLVKNGVTPLSFGGDHLVTLGALRGVARNLGPVAVLQFDAHLDTWDTYFGSKYTHGSFMRRAMEEGLVDAGGSLQVGIRGPLFGAEDMETVHALGLEILPMDGIVDWPVERILSAIRGRIGVRKVYLTFDIDAVDPAFTPGTGTPEVGGFTSQQAVAIIQGLTDLDIIGADVVEVAPSHDPAQITSLMAARLGFEILSLIALNRRKGK